MEFKDYYRVLGVDRNADAATIKRKYRQLAKKYHPDTHPGDAEAEASFKDVSEAYDVLGNPEKKARYDEMLKYGFGGMGGGRGGQAQDFSDLFGGGFGDGFSDIFDLFTGRRSGGGRAGSNRVRRGEDIEVTMKISFAQAVSGGTLKLKVPQRTPCDVCQGSGARPGGGQTTCSACGGSGQQAHNQAGFSISRPCPACGGRGQIIREKCLKCQGEGFTRQRREVRVEVPAGVEDGQHLRISGEGHRGRGGAPSGHLLVTIQVKEDPRFRRQGKDIYTRLEIRLSEALRGCRTTVDTPTSSVQLTIPAGIQPGQKLKLKGEGIPGRGGKGDLYVEIQVRLPRRLTAAGEELLARLEKEWDE